MAAALAEKSAVRALSLVSRTDMCLLIAKRRTALMQGQTHTLT